MSKNSFLLLKGALQSYKMELGAVVKSCLNTGVLLLKIYVWYNPEDVLLQQILFLLKCLANI